VKNSINRLDNIIISIIDVYSGYHDIKRLTHETRNYLQTLNQYSLDQLFNYMLEQNCLLVSLDELVIAILHFQALNSKYNISIPGHVQPKLKFKFKKYQDVAFAAARCNKVLMQEFLGRSTAIQEVKQKVWHSCFSKSLFNSLNSVEIIKQQNILISGETGTGKELIAKAIQNAAFWHNPSKDEPAPAKVINITAVPETVVAAQLFGYKKGTFTDAKHDKHGLIKLAHQGTIFLDEVGDLTPEIQVKLLRAVQERAVLPLGADKEELADVRYISATNKDILSDTTFRRDFYERIAGIVIYLPPLRERREDIIPISNKLIRSDSIKDFITIEDKNKLFEMIRDDKFDWPGNVRQLETVLRNFILGIDIKDTLYPYNRIKRHKLDYNYPNELLDCKWTEKQLINWYLEYVAAKTNNNINRMSKILGIDRTTILRRRDKVKANA